MSFFNPNQPASNAFTGAEDTEHDALNDETFGVDTATLDANFNFGQPHGMPIMTVDHLEAQFRQTQVRPPVQPMVMSAAALEAQMLSLPQQAMNAPQPQIPAQVAEPVSQGRSAADYNGLMTDYEKNLIARIQLSQLASDETFEDDYYFRMRRESKEKKEAPKTDLLAAILGKKDDGGDGAASDEKFQKLLAEAKAIIRPKATQLAIQGALGNIAINSLRNPKQIVQINSSKLVDEDDTQKRNRPSRSLSKQTLQTIEKLYCSIMGIDELYRKWSESANAPQSVSEETKAQWNSEYTRLVKTIWQDLLSIGQLKSAVEKDIKSEDLLKQEPQPVAMALFLSYGKGRKLVRRLLRFLPEAQALSFLKSIFLSLRGIMLVSTDPIAVLSELDDYANRVVYAFVPTISEIPLQFIVDCLSAVLTSGELMMVARTKPGLLLLTLFISRAEIIKQKQQADAALTQQWSTALFPSIFAAFSTRYAGLFPPSHILPPIVTSSLDQLPQPIPVDDQYVWQFLAAMAVGSSPDQQRVLVSESRDRIFETVRMQGQRGKDKVNIFLNALGLDVSQLAA